MTTRAAGHSAHTCAGVRLRACMCAHRREDQGTHMCLGMDGEAACLHACVPVRGTHRELWPLLLPYGREALENDIARQAEAIANSTDLPHLSRATEPFPLTRSCAGGAPSSHHNMPREDVGVLGCLPQCPRRARLRLHTRGAGEASPPLPQLVVHS